MNLKLINQLLQREFLARKQKNRAYSLRAFAKYLGIGIATLSDVMASKRTLSVKNFEKVATKLNLSPHELAMLKDIGEKKEIHKLQLEEHQFQIVSDWYHYAILSLAEIANHKAQPTWIAKRLGISELEASLALERMISMKLIEITNNKIILKADSLCSTVDTPSSAIKKRHKQILELASENIDHFDIDQRFYFEITMAIDPAKIAKAKDKIRKAIRKISKELESGEKSEVYSIETVLFPLKRIS